MDAPSKLTQEAPLAEEALPLGFRFAGVHAGLKESGKADFACAVAEQAAAAAAVFTSNKVQAAPLLVGRRHLERSQGRIRALIVNSGNANCATGEAGIAAAENVCAKAGQVFSCPGEAVFPSSTGIIGVPLPAEKLIHALPALNAALGSSAAHLEQMARAIMTTDTRPKLAAARIAIDGRSIRLAGIAKGAGMICPQLAAPHATMLTYIFTDAVLTPDAAAVLLGDAVATTFNRISIDGDTSTNDTVMLWASGASGVRVSFDSGSSAKAPDRLAGQFAPALHAICLSLAKQIVADGEGARHLVELDIVGAKSDRDALAIARAIAHSPLVKTSWSGCDPNWGRILAAVGYADASVDPARVNIFLGEMEICNSGGISPRFDREAGRRTLEQPEFTIRVELGLGQGACRFWTCDLSEEYVHINADYPT